MKTQEIWRPVVGYEGLYEVSNLGRVRSIDRRVYNYLSETMLLKGKLKAICNLKQGYKGVSLCKNGKMKVEKIHRLVAMAFISNPFNYKTVNHINQDKSDNRVENLEWMPLIENVKYSQARMVGMFKENILLKVFECMADAANEINGCKGGICQCCKGKRKTYKGFEWKYVN